MENHFRESASEKVTILALAYRAGIAGQQNGISFSILPSTKGFDEFGKFDLMILKTRGNFTRKLRVDVTTSKKYKKVKIARAIRRAKQGRSWPFILWVAWDRAAFPALSPCFQKAWDQIQDGKPIALTEACPVHGNDCDFARELLDYSGWLNAIFENEKTEARYFAMPLLKPPF